MPSNEDPSGEYIDVKDEESTVEYDAEHYLVAKDDNSNAIYEPEPILRNSNKNYQMTNTNMGIIEKGIESKKISMLNRPLPLPPREETSAGISKLGFLNTKKQESPTKVHAVPAKKMVSPTQKSPNIRQSRTIIKNGS